MKRVSVIGAGMNIGTVTPEALAAIQGADVLIGAKRMIDMFSHLGKPAWEAFLPEEVRAAIERWDASHFAVLVSGDTGFYSAAEGLVKALNGYDVTVLPGISSLSCFFARLKRPWQDAALISCHGRDANLIDAVRRNGLTFALTGGNIAELIQQLASAGFADLPVTVGENLGTEQERIRRLSVSEWREADTSPLSVMLIENPDFDDRIPTGIPDDKFIRGSVPMTKAEVRSVIMSKLSIRPRDVCCDVGCGTGSVAVEMALSAYKGRVYAIDRKDEAVELTKANCAAFHTGNVTAISGRAPDVLKGLPPMDAVFIGGSGGNMRDIIAHISKESPNARIVAAAIALQSVNAALAAFEECGIAADVTQISAAKAKEINGLHMMTALNPIFIISGGGNG